MGAPSTSDSTARDHVERPEASPVATRMADVIAERAGAGGACTEDDLIAAGFSLAEIAEYRDAARAIFRQRVVRQVEATEPETPAKPVDESPSGIKCWTRFFALTDRDILAIHELIVWAEENDHHDCRTILAGAQAAYANLVGIDEWPRKPDGRMPGSAE